MTPLRIEFIPDRKYLLAWGVAGVLTVGVLAIYAPRWYALKQRTDAAVQELASIAEERKRLNISTRTPSDPRLNDAQRTAAILQLDLNPMFAVIENLQEPGVRLRQMNFDATSGAIRVEYEVDSMPRASSITAALNAGFERPPWRLESLSSSPEAGTSPSFAGTAPLTRGFWSTHIDRLR